MHPALIRSVAVALAVSLLCVQASAGAETETGRWVEVDREDDIQTWKLEVPGEPMPGFRGRTQISASPEAILREIARVENHTKWMHRCAEARLIERFDEDHVIVYNRTDTPWPVWDRDVVLETRVRRQDDGRRVRLSFRDVQRKDVPLPDRTVRMPRLEGSYLLEQTDDGQTRVTYTIEVDIGGSIPDWLAERVARDMPYETLDRLRERLSRVED